MSPNLQKDLPLGIFPTQWFDRTDEGKLKSFLDGIKKNVLDKFFGHFTDLNKVPTVTQLKKASDELNQSLKNEIICVQLYEILDDSKKLELGETQCLTAHLNNLLPEFVVSNPVNIQYDLPKITLTIIATLGALAGFILGGMAIGYVGNAPADTGHLVGAVLGAALFTFAAISIVNNPKWQWWLQTGVVVVGIGDIGLQGGKKALLSKLFIRKAVSKFFLKRMLTYTGTWLISRTLKRVETYDHARFREHMETAIDQYLRSVLPLVVALMFRAGAGTQDGGTKRDELITEIVRIASRTRLRDTEDADELIQEIEKGGFTVTIETPASTLIWDTKLADTYDTFGHIPDGKLCDIVTPPVIQNGNVIAKGKVIRHKGKQI
jgi:hypothetical protein